MTGAEASMKRPAAATPSSLPAAKEARRSVGGSEKAKEGRKSAGGAEKEPRKSSGGAGKAAAAKASPRKSSGGAGKAAAPKANPLAGPFNKVMGGVEVADIPQGAKDMLREMLEGSLGVLEEERDKYQIKVVDMIGEVLSGAENRLQKRVDEAGASIEESMQLQQELEGQSEAASKLLDAKTQDVSVKKRALAVVAKRFQTARAGLQEALQERDSAESAVAGAGTQKEELESTRAELLQPLMDGSCREEAVTVQQEKIESLVKRLTPFNFDSSLLASLPSTLAKAPEARGPFDTMVLTSTEEAVKKQVAFLEATLKDAEPTKAARASAVLAAEKLLENATQEQIDAADTYTAERKEEERLEQEANDLRQKFRSQKEVARRLERERAKAVKAVASLQEGPADIYQMMKHTLPAGKAKQAEEPEEEAKAGEAVVAGAASMASGEAAAEAEGGDAAASAA